MRKAGKKEPMPFRVGSLYTEASTFFLSQFFSLHMVKFLNKIEVKSKEEFLDAVKKAEIVIFPVNTSLPVWQEFVCSIGGLHMRVISYRNYEVVEVLPPATDLFRLFWSKTPHIKYYFVNKLDDNDKYGAVIPAKSDELVEKLLEDMVK